LFKGGWIESGVIPKIEFKRANWQLRFTVSEWARRKVSYSTWS